MADDDPRVYTRDEVREMFLDHVRNMIDYWTDLYGELSVRDRVEGVAFSILSCLDGSTELPGFIISPCPHESDKNYLKGEGLNWFPEEGDRVDIGGSLHEHLFKDKGKD